MLHEVDDDQRADLRRDGVGGLVRRSQQCAAEREPSLLVYTPTVSTASVEVTRVVQVREERVEAGEVDLRKFVEDHAEVFQYAGLDFLLVASSIEGRLAGVGGGWTFESSAASFPPCSSVLGRVGVAAESASCSWPAAAR